VLKHSSPASGATIQELCWHPHGHLLTTDGGFCEDGAFRRLESWDADAVMKLLRERLLARLVDRHAISEELARKLVAWTHPGFSSYVAKAIPFENRKAVEDLACYLVRAPLSLQKLVYLDGQKAVLYRSRMNPSLGRNFEAMDPLEWLARLADHIPDPGRHRTHFYAHYANRVRGERPGEEEPRHTDEAEPRRRCSPSWARLIAKVFQADPLVCRRCGGPLKVVAYITDSLAIRQILDHLDLSPPEKPPPETRDVVRVPIDDEGREIEVQPA
jgi:Putative transposase